MLLVLVVFGADFSRLKHQYSYSADSLFKLLQAWSLVQQNYQSEEIYYPKRNIDPAFALYPAGFPYIVQNKGRVIGQYPLFLSAMNAVLLEWLGMKGLLFVMLFLCGVIFAFLCVYYRFSPAAVFLTGFGTPLFLYAYELSEHPYLLLFQLLGLFFLFRKKWYLQILSAFFLGIGVFLRLESLLFNACLSLILVLVRARPHYASLISSKIHERFLAPVFREILKLLPFLFVLFLVHILFFVYNYLDYGHILGPRFLVNVRGTGFSVTEQIRRAFVLLFAGYYKVGLFGFTPIFLLVYIYYLLAKRHRLLGEEAQVLLFSTVAFVCLIALSAPNDGAINWGSRYLNLAFLPSLILSDHFFQRISIRSWKLRLPVYFLAFFSLVICYMGIRIEHGAYKQVQSYQEDFQKTKSSHILLQNQILAYHAGTMLFTHNFMIPRRQESLGVLVANATKGEYPDLVYVEPLPPKAMQGLAREVYDKTLLDEKGRRIKQSIWDSFQISKAHNLRHIRFYRLRPKN